MDLRIFARQTWDSRAKFRVSERRFCISLFSERFRGHSFFIIFETFFKPDLIVFSKGLKSKVFLKYYSTLWRQSVILNFRALILWLIAVSLDDKAQQVILDQKLQLIANLRPLQVQLKCKICFFYYKTVKIDKCERYI